MQTKTYKTLDRSDWGLGEWDNEPDKMQWPDEQTALPSLAVRGPMGGWCGYVGVPPSHPWHGKGYDDVDVEVHGGLTFANKCRPHESEADGICHVPEPGEPDDVWWFGFDCAHAWDGVPVIRRMREAHPMLLRVSLENDQYKPLTYIQAECAKLAAQLADAAYPSERQEVA